MEGLIEMLEDFGITFPNNPNYPFCKTWNPADQVEPGAVRLTSGVVRQLRVELAVVMEVDGAEMLVHHWTYREEEIE